MKAKSCKNRAIQLAQWTGALLHTINEMLKKNHFKHFKLCEWLNYIVRLISCRLLIANKVVQYSGYSNYAMVAIKVHFLVWTPFFLGDALPGRFIKNFINRWIRRVWLVSKATKIFLILTCFTTYIMIGKETIWALSPKITFIYSLFWYNLKYI